MTLHVHASVPESKQTALSISPRLRNHAATEFFTKMKFNLWRDNAVRQRRHDDLIQRHLSHFIVKKRVLPAWKRYASVSQSVERMSVAFTLRFYIDRWTDFVDCEIRERAESKAAFFLEQQQCKAKHFTVWFTIYKKSARLRLSEDFVRDTVIFNAKRRTLGIWNLEATLRRNAKINYSTLKNRRESNILKSCMAVWRSSAVFCRLQRMSALVSSFSILLVVVLAAFPRALAHTRSTLPPTKHSQIKIWQRFVSGVELSRRSNENNELADRFQYVHNAKKGFNCLFDFWKSKVSKEVHFPKFPPVCRPWFRSNSLVANVPINKRCATLRSHIFALVTMLPTNFNSGGLLGQLSRHSGAMLTAVKCYAEDPTAIGFILASRNCGGKFIKRTLPWLFPCLRAPCMRGKSKREKDAFSVMASLKS